MKLNAGTKKPLPPGVEGYIDSMAEAMEIAFKDEWPGIMHADTPQLNDHIRLLFIAIARGVVKHLKDHPQAFDVTVGSNGHGRVTKINAIEYP